MLGFWDSMRLTTPFVPRIGVLGFLHEQPQGPGPSSPKTKTYHQCPPRGVHVYEPHHVTYTVTPLTIACVALGQPGHWHMVGGSKQTLFVPTAHEVGRVGSQIGLPVGSVKMGAMPVRRALLGWATCSPALAGRRRRGERPPQLPPATG